MNRTIKELERDCIACPVIYDGKTTNDDYVRIRYRWGTVRVEKKDSKESSEKELLLEKEIGDEYDGYLSPVEIIELLEESGLEYQFEFDEQYYGVPFEDCEFDIFGKNITYCECEKCGWGIKGDELITVFEYDVIVPIVCPNCDTELSFEVENPLKNLASE